MIRCLYNKQLDKLMKGVVSKETVARQVVGYDIPLSGETGSGISFFMDLTTKRKAIIV